MQLGTVVGHDQGRLPLCAGNQPGEDVVCVDHVVALPQQGAPQPWSAKEVGFAAPPALFCVDEQHVDIHPESAERRDLLFDKDAELWIGLSRVHVGDDENAHRFRASILLCR